MQGKVTLEHRAAEQVTVGIDVCKAWLDIHILPANTTIRVANTKKGHKQLLAALKGLAVDMIVVEATGKYHRSAHRVLHEAGWPVAVANPLRTRLFAEGIGMLAKTDKVDARMLAIYARMAVSAVTPPLPEKLENLREIVRARQAAMANRVALHNQLQAASLASVKVQIKRQISAARAAIKALEANAVELARTEPTFVRRLEILGSIAGIGEISAVMLVANMPELGSLSEKKAAMLAGLAPVACDSGQRNAPRHIKGGRAQVRSGIYMAALSAARYNPDLKAFYERLVGKGKPPKVAITAVMRKLLALANILIKENRTWNPVPPVKTMRHA